MSDGINMVLRDNVNNIKRTLHGLYEGISGLRALATAAADGLNVTPPGDELEALAVRLHRVCDRLSYAAGEIPQEIWAEGLYGEATAGTDEMRNVFMALIARSGEPLRPMQEDLDEFREEAAVSCGGLGR